MNKKNNKCTVIKWHRFWTRKKEEKKQLKQAFTEERYKKKKTNIERI